MNKSDNNLLNYSEVIFIVFGSIVGVGVLSLPRDVCSIAYEDGWIAVIFGGVYPLYMVILASYLSKKFPEKNIIELSKKYLGKLIGNILNFAFMTYFIVFTAAIIAGYKNIITTFVTEFLSGYKIIVVLLLLAAYSCSKGIKVLGKISVVVFFVTVLIFISPIPALKVASILNVSPMLETNLKDLYKASIESVYAYAGVETLFLIYPDIKDKKKVLSASVIGVFITMIIYTWVTFITTYYLGADIVNKSYWPFLSVTESVTISIVNNFRYIFMFLWTLSVFKIIANDYYMAVLLLNGFFKKINFKVLCYLLVPIVFLITIFLGNFVKRGEILSYIVKWYVIFNVFYVTIISFMVFIKNRNT